MIKRIQCGKDMEPPAGYPILGLALGVRYQDFEFPHSIEAFNEYCKRQYGKHEPIATGLCCECIMDNGARINAIKQGH